MEIEPREIRVDEAAELVGCSKESVYRAARLGLVKARVVLRAGAKSEWRIDEESLREWRRTVKKGRPPQGWPGRTGTRNGA